VFRWHFHIAHQTHRTNTIYIAYAVLNLTLLDQIASLEKAYAHETKIDANALRVFFTNFKTAFENATIKEKRELMRTFIRHLELIPENEEIRVEFYPDNIVQSIGAGDRNQTYTAVEDRWTLFIFSLYHTARRQPAALEMIWRRQLMRLR